MSGTQTKKVLAVIGATGKQGGSVINSVLGDPKAATRFSVRALTRDTSKPAAQELARKGCETVSADVDDKESLRKALKGAYAVFAVTNFWEKMNPDVEYQQGKNIADVSKESGVQHLIWSSLMNVTKLSNGKLPNVTHFDKKAEVESYIRSIDIPATFFLPGFYMSNIPGQQLNNFQGVYNFALPTPTDTPIPLFDAEHDTGKFVKAILLNREKTLGKQILGATDYYTPEQIFADFQAVKPRDGQGGKAFQMPDDMFKKILGDMGLPPAAQQELLENMHLLHVCGYYGGADLKPSQEILDEPLTTWKEYVAKTPVFADVH